MKNIMIIVIVAITALSSGCASPRGRFALLDAETRSAETIEASAKETNPIFLGETNTPKTTVEVPVDVVVIKGEEVEEKSKISSFFSDLMNILGLKGWRIRLVTIEWGK